MGQVISPISLDLGGKYTGVYMPHYYTGVLPEKDDAVMATLVMPEDGDKITWSQTNRTATRHRIRSNKRRKLAKRLTKVVIETLVDRPLLPQEINALSGLLNRRGYNRLEIELDLSCLEQTPSIYFAQLLPDYFTEAATLLEQWDSLLENTEYLRELQQLEVFKYSKRDAKKVLFTKLEKSEQEECLIAYHTLQEAVSQTLDSLDYGHQHRREYLHKIKVEIGKDARLRNILKTTSVDELFCLLGNIGNFQLRNLRWYFNDVQMRSADRFDDKRLRDTTIRWLQGWHPQTDEEKQNRRLALAHMQSSISGLDALRNLSPLMTIPPYEDQNNRRPPKDQTLWLNPVTLTARYGEKWLVWAQNAQRKNPSWGEGIQENLANFERKSRLKRHDLPAPDKEYAAAIFLQRLLDRSRQHDCYGLRLISRGHNQSQEAQQYLENLTRDLGSQHIEGFLQLARDYYAEVASAKQGIWFQSKSGLLERADINPPSKAKIKHRLVSNIICTELSPSELDFFLREVWESKVQGNSTVRSICKSIEDIRKHYGNSFNHEIQKISYRISKDPALEKKLKGEEKSIWNANQRALLAARKIAQQLEHTDEQLKRYNNSFSMAQLYSILETDRHGFSKISIAAHNETAWRMRMVETSDGISARCSRLPADSVRPFDGILRRLLERQAYEIAQLKIRQLKDLNTSTGKILIPIIAEENKFEFSIGLAGIKKNRVKAQQLEKQLQNQQVRWQDKTTRIKEAAGGVCPYTGELIRQRGEIDHIVPRSLSLERSSTIYNSEANLIWTSRRGNQDKLDMRKGMTDLHPGYLQKIFGKPDLASIEQHIEAVVAQLKERFIFTELTKEQQDAVRHALFLSPYSNGYKKVYASLATQQVTRVNGTQAWLIKRVIELLEKEFSGTELELVFLTARVNAQQTSELRTQLGQFDERYAKQDIQSVASHSLDALCAFAVAAGNELHEQLGLGKSLLVTEQQSAELLVSLIAQQVVVLQVERKPRFAKDSIVSQAVFKEGIYAENLLPLWVYGNEIYVGFDGYNKEQCVAFNTNNPEKILELLQPVLTCKITEPMQLLNSPKPQKLELQKNAAFMHLDKVAKQSCCDQDLLLADLIDLLRYTTINKECRNTIYDSQKKTYKSQQELLDSKFFTINLSFKDKNLGKIDGKLILPAREDWKNLLKIPEISTRLGTKGDDLNWQCIFKSNFKYGSQRAHNKTRRVFSLPRIDAPSGGFRVRRITPDQQSVWQLMSIEGLSSCGFQVSKGKIHWDQTMPIRQLVTENLTEVKARFFAGTGEYISFDHWLQIKQDYSEIISLEMAPGTKDRRYLRITQPYSVFHKWILEAGVSNLDSYWELRSEVKIDAKNFASAHAIPLLGVPRSNLFIQSLGEQVTYWYIVSSSTSIMKEAYQAAYLESIKKGSQ